MKRIEGVIGADLQLHSVRDSSGLKWSFESDANNVTTCAAPNESME